MRLRLYSKRKVKQYIQYFSIYYLREQSNFVSLQTSRAKVMRWTFEGKDPYHQSKGHAIIRVFTGNV